MRSIKSKKNILPATSAIAGLLLAAGSVYAGSTTVNMTAERMSVTMADGNTIPMWGYCDATETSDTVTTPTALPGTAACNAPTAWKPGPTITIPYDPTGTSLTINLTNNLPVATSIMIAGQFGGGLGQPTREPSPAHPPQTVTWPAGDATVKFFPPKQADRARSFSPEAAYNGGTYSYTWAHLKPGTYIYQTGSHPSIQNAMGLYGVLVVTEAPDTATSTAGTAYPASTTFPVHDAITYDADAVLLFSEIDPKQNAAVDQAALASAGCTADLTVPCTGTINEAYYPPAVNYTPIYFLINGNSFDPTDPNSNVLSITNPAVTGKVMLRLANAGSHSHVPTTIGLPMSVIAEDGNVKPGNPVIVSQMLLPAGKTNDVMVSPPTASTTLPSSYNPGIYSIFDREEGTSANKQSGGMQAVLQVAGGSLPTAVACLANADSFAVKAGSTFFAGNVLSNDRGISNAAVATAAANGTVTMKADGSFTYVPNSVGSVTADTFTYSGTCAGTGVAYTATVSITPSAAGVPVATADAYSSKLASLLKVNAPGVLTNDTDSLNYTLSAVIDTVPAGLNVELQPDGSFTAAPTTTITAATNYTFTYHVVNAEGVASAPTNVDLTFTPGSGLQVSVVDTTDKSQVAVDPISNQSDYSWVIEEDKTYYADPTNPSGSGTTTGNTTPPQSISTNFHQSFMPLVAAGCTGPRSCGDANTVNGGTPVTPAIRSFPSDVVLDPNKRYFISVVPADAMDGDPDTMGTTTPVYGHSMGGATIAPGKLAVTVLTPRNPLPGGQISVIVFEDSGPTNGGVDANEPGLGGFTINLFDTRGSTGDPAGQTTYDLAGMPLTNALAGTKDANGANMCPLSTPMGVVTTCPETYTDSTGATVASPLAGMALIKNVEPGRYDVLAIPGADRENKGETWVQVSTLEGTPVNDTFVKPGEPGYWQEFGSPGFHSFIGFINPDHVKAKQAADAAASANPAAWNNTITGNISSLHMDRPPAGNLNDSCANLPTVDDTCRAALSYTQCQVAINLNGNAEDISYAKCDPQGNFKLTGIPPGTHELAIWDEWLDQIIAYKSVTVPVSATNTPQTIAMGSIPVFSWFTRIAQTAYIDENKNGVRDPGENGLRVVPLNVRFRDGSISNYLSTDLAGDGGTNELFPLFNWYVLETDTTRYKGTGVHVVYDSGGKPDTTATAVTDLLGNSIPQDFSGVLNSKETVPLPANLQYPGSVYTAGTTQRIDPGSVTTEGVQGYINQTAVVEWGKVPYDKGENGGITGMVYYASTRAFDDPQLETQLSWEPGVPNVKINLYSETINADGTKSLTLVDSTLTDSWDDYVHGTHVAADGSTVPNISCPGDAASDPFVGSTLGTANQFKCYDGQHSFNQVQPAVYDGRYNFPTANCKICGADPADSSKTMLPIGKYVVEIVMPEGYKIVKEEDNNIFYGDPWMNPDTATQFAGIGNVFILKDQATLNSPIAMGSGVPFPPCVGRMHRVPDYLAQFPDQQMFAPYAGEDRPLCDRKEVTLDDQSQGGADFQVFTDAMVAGHFTGLMLNDAAAEFDPYSPSFGEKAALPNAPIAIRDYNGIEIGRIYNDKYGNFNGLTVSTFDANVPNPSGYAPNMLTWCMNDPGPIPDPSGAIDPATGKTKMIIDPMYNPMFSNFCYAWPTMPGQTSYLDTPVLPTAAYANASSYAPVDCQYPDTTPAIARVDAVDAVSGSHIGPWLDRSHNGSLVIQALGDVQVLNPAYAGPTALDAPANQPKITRHYGFGAAQGSGTVKLLGPGLPADGMSLPIASWSDASITTGLLPSQSMNAGNYQIVITAANGNSTIDTVTLHYLPHSDALNVKVVEPVTTSTSTSGLAHPIQDAIDAANPGDLIILDAGSYPELVVMYKPVQLQGVGAASVVINATKYPSAKLRDWRTKINSLFGLDNQGNVLPGDPVVDPLPGQEINAGVVMLEPSVLGSEEGAGITVLAKGYEADGTTLLNGGRDCRATSANYSSSNFLCAHGYHHAMIDGVSVTGGDSGGGIYVNGWAHRLEIANNRVFGNAGPWDGGVRIGQPYLQGQALPTGRIPGNFGLGYDQNVNIHNNNISTNGMVEGAPGATAAANAGGAGGGLSIAAGTDYYRVTSNWICGNYASSDGGGIGHVGLSNHGLIAKNYIIFNESYQQTGQQNGGGIAIEGDIQGGLGSGNVTIDSNLIQGNFARAGDGGGIRLQYINGQDASYPVGQRWSIRITNNMITNNLAGWAGAGISVSDAIRTAILNNTVANNDSMGMTGNLFNKTALGGTTGPSTGLPNPAGISTELTSQPLLAFLSPVEQVTDMISKPRLQNNIIWHNRSFFFDMSSGTAQVLPSNNWADSLSSAKPAPLVQQTTVGECVSGAKYWDLGVADVDTSPTVNTDPNLRLDPRHSVMTDATGYAANNITSDPLMIKPYCNGSRVLPGRQFEPGTPFQPNFQLNAAATLDESGNFVDLHFGPISLTDPGNTAAVVFNGDYHLTGTSSSAVDTGVTLGGVTHDYDGDARPQGAAYDIGGDELAGAATLAPNPLVFPDTTVGTTSAAQTITLTNTGLFSLTLNTGAVTIAGLNAGDFAVNAAGTTCTDGLVIAVGASCNISVTFSPTAQIISSAILSVADSVGTQSVTLQGTGTGGPTPVVSLSSTTLAFGSVTAGTTATLTETVTNIGSGPLVFPATNAVVVSGASEFALQAGTDSCTGNTIPVGGNCSVTVTFSPTTATTTTVGGTLTFTDNAPDSPQVVALSGR